MGLYGFWINSLVDPPYMRLSAEVANITVVLRVLITLRTSDSWVRRNTKLGANHAVTPALIKDETSEVVSAYKNLAVLTDKRLESL